MHCTMKGSKLGLSFSPKKKKKGPPVLLYYLLFYVIYVYEMQPIESPIPIKCPKKRPFLKNTKKPNYNYYEQATNA